MFWDRLRIKNLRKIGQNTNFSLNSESSLGRTKMLLGRRLDAPVLNIIFQFSREKQFIILMVRFTEHELLF
jgi:hypothetical protein